MMSMSKDVTLSEGETAMVAAIRILINIMQDAGTGSAATFDVELGLQRAAFCSKDMQKAAAIMTMLRDFACDPVRSAERTKNYYSSNVQEGSA